MYEGQRAPPLHWGKREPLSKTVNKLAVHSAVLGLSYAFYIS